MPATPAPEQMLPDPSPAAVTRRALAWSGLGLLLAGAAATRLAGTTAPVGTGDTRQAVELVSLPPDEAAVALATSPFDPASRAAMLAAVRRRELHLVRAPFFGVGGAIGAAVTVTCGTVSRPIVLAAAPVGILLPIERLGRIVVSASAPIDADARIGLLTQVAPVMLPPPGPWRSLVLDVIVQ